MGITHLKTNGVRAAIHRHTPLNLDFLIALIEWSKKTGKQKLEIDLLDEGFFKEYSGRPLEKWMKNFTTEALTLKQLTRKDNKPYDIIGPRYFPEGDSESKKNQRNKIAKRGALFTLKHRGPKNLSVQVTYKTDEKRMPFLLV